MVFRRFILLSVVLLLSAHCSSGQKSPSDDDAGSDVSEQMERKTRRICVTGNGVRMRSGPSLNSRVLGSYYWLDAFDDWEVVGKPVRIGEFNKPWYLLKGVHHGAASSPFQGYMYGQFLGDCDNAFRQVVDRLEDPSIPWQDRIMHLEFIVSEPYRDHRFIEGKKVHSWKASDSGYLTTNATDVHVVEKRGDLLITTWTLKEFHAEGANRGQPARNYRIRCEYSGFELEKGDREYGVKLIQVGDSNQCAASAYISVQLARTYEAYPDG
ncbi:MAG: hypothetical protein RH862_13240 [Leptospiraceae bacterium]